MRKLRELSKTCPECQKKVGVALKSCKCGFNFTRQTRSGAGSSRREPKGSSVSRRTARVRTAKKPNFYDSQEFEKKKKRPKSTRTAVKTTILGKQTTPQDDSPNSKNLREARAKQRRMKKEEIEDIDLADKLSQDKQELAKVILAEINRKLSCVVWQPTF